MPYSPLLRRLSAEWSARTRGVRGVRLSPQKARSTAWTCSEAHLDRINATIAHAWRRSTSTHYARYIDEFISFCSGNGVPASACLPASEPLLCAFASSFAGNLAGRTIRNKCSAIRKWHIANGLHWHGGTQLAYVIKGAENLRPASSIQPLRPAVTADMLSALTSALDPHDPLDACVLFVATTAFWGQIRLGELLPTKESDTTCALVPSWKDLGTPNLAGSQILHLPRTKTGGTRGESVLITRQSSLDPIAFLNSHRELNGDTTSILASCRLPSGELRALTRRKFIARCNGILAPAGFPHISGHCFRIGGTTHLLLAGVPPDIVKLMGRWSSDSFLRYWRSLEIIAPLYAELLNPIGSSWGGVHHPA